MKKIKIITSLFLIVALSTVSFAGGPHHGPSHGPHNPPPPNHHHGGHHALGERRK